MMMLVILLLIAISAIIGFIYIKKSALRIILGIIAAISLLLACLLGGAIYIMHYKINSVDTSTSPDGTYELSFQQIGDPDWPFGYTHARLVLKNGKEIVLKKSFDIANDGGNASINNWNVNWKDSSVEVIIYGEEQSDVLYILNFDGTDARKQLDTHYGYTEEERQQISANQFEENPSKPAEESISVSTDADGYPLTDEYQSYKEEMKAIAEYVSVKKDSELQYFLTAKGYPYAVISSQVDDNGRIIRKELILNEAYQDEIMHEYVLEELSFDSDGKEMDDSLILDFYLIDCETLTVTDEQTNHWH